MLAILYALFFSLPAQASTNALLLAGTVAHTMDAGLFWDFSTQSMRVKNLGNESFKLVINGKLQEDSLLVQNEAKILTDTNESGISNISILAP